MAVNVTCDICGKVLEDHHLELFHYTVDEDGEDIEHGYDVCSLDCNLTLAMNLADSVGVL